MGRFDAWINRTLISRGARRCEEFGRARRRTLAFEQCESRIALSATQAAYSFWTVDGVLMTQLWSQTPGAGDWPAVTFAPVDGSKIASAKSAIQVQNASAEGGSITLGMTSDLTLTSYRSTQLVIGNAFSDFDGAVEAMTPRTAGQVGGLTHDFYSFNPGGSDTGILVGPVGNFHSSMGPDSPGSDSTGITGELYLDSPLDAGLAFSTSPVLRITIPAGRGNSEGGAIDLTAMAGPTNVFGARSLGNAELADAGARKVAGALTRAAAPARDAQPIEGLRARAVVYEVADARELGGIGRTLDESPADGQRDPRGSTQGSESDRRSPHDDAAAVRRAQHAESIETEDQTAAVDGALSAEAKSPAEEFAVDSGASREHTVTNSTGAGVAAAHDAALADWNDRADRTADLTARDADAAGLTFAASRRQKAGVAFALVVGVGPLVRRARRSKSHPNVDQPPRRQPLPTKTIA
jgi:hypothetical protein